MKRVVFGNGVRPNDELFSIFATSLLFFVLAMLLALIFVFIVS